MSNRAMNWAFEQGDIVAGAKFVLVALADHASDHAGEDWACYPSVERLMAFTNQSRATVERHLASLVDAGLISRVRRKLAGGRLGVYDYVLHRDRRAVPEPETAPYHTSNCSMDHASNCDPAMRQIEGQPCLNLQHVITPIEPSVEPSQGASARVTPDWAREIWLLWPAAGRAASSLRLVAEAVATELAAGADPAALVVGARAYAKDRASWGASGSPVAPHRFLAEGRWENFAIVIERPMGSPGSSAGTAVPSAVRAAFLAAHGEATTASYLDPCGWREEDQTLLARTDIARDWLRRKGFRVERLTKADGVR